MPVCSGQNLSACVKFIHDKHFESMSIARHPFYYVNLFHYLYKCMLMYVKLNITILHIKCSKVFSVTREQSLWDG